MNEPNSPRQTNGRWVKGFSGNKKGNLHPHTRRAIAIKSDIYEVFDLLGGKIGFYDWAKTNLKDAYDMIVKILPKEIKAEGMPNESRIIIVHAKSEKNGNIRRKVSKELSRDPE